MNTYVKYRLYNWPGYPALVAKADKYTQNVN